MNIASRSDAPECAATVTIDADSIMLAAAVIFDGLGGFVDVRLLAEKGMPEQPPRCRSFAVDEHLGSALMRCAAEAANDGTACHVVPSTTRQKGRATAASIAQTAVVAVDLDDGEIEAKRAHLGAHLGAPTLTVASGGKTSSGEAKLHLYWQLDAPAQGEDLERVRVLRRLIARKVGADPSLARLQQPLRLAGSIHGKNGVRSAVSVLQHTGAVRALGALEVAADAMPTMILEEVSRPTGKNDSASVTRFDALSRFMGEQLRQVRLRRMTRAAAWEAVRAFNTSDIKPAWDDGRLRREFDALARVDQANYERRADVADLDLTEHGMARRLVDEHATRWRYVSGQATWLEWTGTHWRHDETHRVLEVCRQLCEAAAVKQTPSDRRWLLSERTIRAVERLARCDPRISAGAAEWDRDEMLLNTPAGVLDLGTGELVPSDPALQLTRITRAAPGEGCPLWLRFIARITNDDAEMAGYLQRIAGYCLTGRTDEQAFFLLHGSGANGKTVFLEVLADVLGSYARSAPLDAFMAARGDRQSFDLAGLDGARMVVATETESGRSWAESRIKAITGGDRIAVRQLYRPFYEMTPVYKLLISGNHRPRISGGGKAMLRRLQLIPFDTVIPEGERDGLLREKLTRERDGILGWMLDGCRDWQKVGLQYPRRMRDAVAGYFESEDFVGQWIAECCNAGSHYSSSTGELFASWRARAEALGIPAGSARDLGERLRDHGFEPCRTSRARGWSGIAPRVTEEGESKP